MNCDDVKNGIYVFLDGEFAAPEEAAFTRHLDACPRCRALAQHEAGFLGCVKDTLGAPEASGDLRARIESSLAATPLPVWSEESGLHTPRRRGGRWTVVAPALAASVAAIVYIALPAGGASAEEASVREQAVAAHAHPLPMEVRGSKEVVRSFLQDNVPFAVAIPFDQTPSVRLVGARLTQVGGQVAVIFRYELDARDVSVLQVPTRTRVANQDEDERQPFIGHMRGYGVATFDQHDVVNTVVGDLPEGEMLQLMRVAYHR
ncbi:MAG: zf-HC2 domain-containing protein [Deltaproteobacteria bacterium]|nr:zf-HC2 domain-containing protein [Deltaproteobacteria bacterium]